MSVLQEELKIRQESTYLPPKLTKKVSFLPSFDRLRLSDFTNTTDLKNEMAHRENYKKLCEFCASNELLRPYYPLSIDITSDSKEKTEELFIKRREVTIAILVKMFEQYIIHFREIQAFARQILKYRNEAESNPEDALQKTRQIILEHLNKMKKLPICSTLNKALQLLPRVDADTCILKFTEIAIEASDVINKFINDQVDRHYALKG